MTVEDFEKKHKVCGTLYDAFELAGGCAHDLGDDVILIIKRWEEIRTDEAVRDLLNIEAEDYWALQRAELARLQKINGTD